MPHRLLRHLIFRQGRDEFVVDQQAVDVQGFVMDRIRGFKFHHTSTLTVPDPGFKRRLEEFRFVLELFHYSQNTIRGRGCPSRLDLPTPDS
jgi:hypothetical protein